MNKTNIEWGIDNLYTWNPITGCKRGCNYCYARRMYRRFHKNVSFEDITVHHDRLEDPDLKKGHKTVFVGSMSDIEYWPKEWLQRVVDICRYHKQHTFMFLSKSAYSYDKIPLWPQNTMQGLTITSNLAGEAGNNISHMDWLPNTFLSIEPLMGKCYHLKNNNFKKIIVGAMTGPKPIEPQKEWIQSIINSVDKSKIFLKPSIKPYLEKFGLHD